MAGKFLLKSPTIKEDDRCELFYKEMTYRMITMKEAPILYHIANEHMVGTAQKHIGFLMKRLRMGMKKGVFDYIAHTKNKVIYIEFKTEKGKLTPNQQVFAEDLTRKEIPFLITSSVDEAIKFMFEHFT